MQTTAQDPDLENIQLQHLSEFQRQIPTILTGQLITTLVVAYLVYGRLPSATIIAWLSASIAVLAVRVAIALLHRRTRNTSGNRRSRIAALIAATAATAMLWGGLAFVLITREDSLQSLVIVMVLTGLVASAVASTGNLRLVFLTFTVLSMGPAAAKFIMLGGAEYITVGLLILFFVIIVSRFELGVHKTLSESIQLRLSNVRLIDNLTLEKERADDARQAAEDALQAAESANQAKSNFLAAASHDLRQPLHALRLFASTLEGTPLEAQQTKIVGNINTCVKSLEELFNALLDLSKLDAGTQTVQPTTTSLATVLNTMRRNYVPMAEERGIEFVVHDSPYTVHTDMALLERLLANLVTNAIRYTTVGTVEICTYQKDTRCHIEVRDTGIGIPKYDQERVFDEFVQLDNPERDRSRGIGLGLSIVKRTADLLHIPLSIESSPNRGSTFTVAVPLGKPGDVLESNNTTPVEPTSIEHLVVLIIEDEVNTREALSGLLESWGCVALSAGDEAEALQLLNELEVPPDVMLADLRLRDNITGVDVLNRLQARFEHPKPCLIMTGDIAPSRLREIKDTAYPVLHKPCNPVQLRDFLVRSVSSSSLICE